jgi:holo-[acyl-carrier protein] synthase
MIRGVGVDLVDVARIRRIAERNEGIFRRRVLGLGEREMTPIARRSVSRWAAYARAVAAKEAFFKAIGTGLGPGMHWNDVELLTDKTGGYRLSISGESRRLFEAIGGARIDVSAASSKRMAIALVLLSTGAVGEDRK